MDRRDFLRCTLVTAGSVVLGGSLVACSDDESTPAGDDTSGADAAVDGTGDTAVGDTTVGDTAPDTGAPPLQPGEAYFPQSIASGDPRPESVVLWARVLDAARGSEDLAVELELALDEAFEERVELDGAPARSLTAEAASDGCVKARVAGLAAGTTYYYRFVYATADARYVSRTGRTKTAPAAGADVPVRFATLNCQDYTGRYYNVLARLLEEEVDFVVHLGDYIYETDGDPSFQERTPERSIVFEDPDGAIVFDEGTDGEYRAARALSNYRDLYKTYRSDGLLQRVHERWPMIIIWDDHEFANDAYGATATYYGGEADERDVERRKNANQAWWEFMPVDYPDAPDFVYDRSVDPPDDIRIYRDFGFGKHVHLVMTDLRSYRPDHLVPEEAFPGAVPYTEEALTAALGEVPALARPYIDIDAYEGGLYAGVLTAAGDDEADVTGNIGVDYVNSVVAAVNEARDPADAVPLIDEAAQATLPRGLAWTQVGKVSKYSAVGSRYFVQKAGFDLYAALRWAETDGASEDTMGAAQEQWFLEAMRNSPKTWKLWGNEFCLVTRHFDLSGLPALPDSLRQIFKINAEDWDGMPNRRDALIGALADIGNVVALTGDIHAFFAGTPAVRNDPSKRIPELVGSSVSSATLHAILVRTAQSDPFLRDAGAVALALAAETLLLDKQSRPNPDLGYAKLAQNGFVLVEAGADQLDATYYAIDEAHVKTDLTGDAAALDEKFQTTRFRVESGSPDLLRDFDGTWKRWDQATADWV